MHAASKKRMIEEEKKPIHDGRGWVSIPRWTVYLPYAVPGVRFAKGITKIGNVNLKSLTAVVIPEGVVEIDPSAFSPCWSLAKVSFPSTLKKIGRFAFRDCGLTNMDLSHTQIESIDRYAFEGCTGLVKVTFPKTLVDIGRCAFLGCTNLTNVDLSKTRITTNIADGVFDGCPKIKLGTTLKLPDGVTY
jgi:hypothetical protein